MTPLPPVPVVLPPAASYGPDTIEEFERAAQARFGEAGVLLAAGSYAGAVYLLGYTAEMLLKAAWFRLMGHAPAQTIEPGDWAAARSLAASLGLPLGNLHNIAAWVRFL